MPLGELPPAPNEDRVHLHARISHEYRIARDGGPSVSSDAWARIDRLLDCLQAIDLTENTGAAPMLDAMVFDQDGTQQ